MESKHMCLSILSFNAFVLIRSPDLHTLPSPSFTDCLAKDIQTSLQGINKHSS